jgi:NRAMP (natural resistance-associated macrophage protein)-like metal ion transporter
LKVSTQVLVKIKRFVRVLGPGLITGASDDDPSGIATYTQAGAAFGFQTLWTALLTFPLMASIQEMCARIGLVTSTGLTTTLKKHYPKWVLYTMLVFSFPAITLNIGADIEGMAAVAHMLVPAIPVFAYSLFVAVLIIFVIIRFPYERIAGWLKWLCIVLLLYILVPFMVKVNWGSVVRHTFIPTLHFNKDFMNMLVAILGTTISPYLFFWQANMEAEDVNCKTQKVIVNKYVLKNMKTDVDMGMLFSNLVMFFIILTAGAVLFPHGIHQVDTIEQAAKALEPLTGKFAYVLFAIGVIGTGLLAIPVLSGSLSYILAETFDLSEGLSKTFKEAKAFYITIIVSVLLGLCLDFVGISPINALIYTAVLYGVTAPVMIAIVLHICNNKEIMGEHTNSKLSNVLGIITFLLMTAAAIALIWFQFG